MTEETVKEFVRSYSELKARRDVIDKIRKYSHNESIDEDQEYSQLAIKIQIIESALELLTEDERTIIYLHLIDNVKWSEVKSIYEQKVGTEFNYSERTFMRIQKNALKKIETFVSKNKFEQYIE
ncbi:MAG: sigma-70 family RNA polymerase sigma factor [Lachnospiraceae bacterium]|nr:sigma-70 family RNA polymerase sigma factor [Lachnospiraceae bacterium]